MTHKNRKKSYRNFIFLGTRCSLLRAEGFSYSLEVLYGGLEEKIAIFDHKKIFKNFQLYYFSSIFGYQHPGSGSGFTESGSTTLDK